MDDIIRQAIHDFRAYLQRRHYAAIRSRTIRWISSSSLRPVHSRLRRSLFGTLSGLLTSSTTKG